MKSNKKFFLILTGVACIILILPALYNITVNSIFQGKNSSDITNQTNGKLPLSGALDIPRVTRETIENPVQTPLLSVSINMQNLSQVVETAQKYLGAPYKPGGDSPEGFDSSGFIQYVFKQHGIAVPRSTAEQFKVGTSVKEPVPGDLVFFNTSGSGVSHVGIYIGNNKFISTTVNKGVKIDSLGDSYWAPKYLGARRL